MSMIQIFGTRKCPETRKAERFFKERGLKFQLIDLKEKAMSKGELRSVSARIGLEHMIDRESKEYERLNLKYMKHDIEEQLLAHPLLIKTPVIRYGQQATLGYQPDVWKQWS
jgi:arsenate reductase